jgi:hypothetical protein
MKNYILLCFATIFFFGANNISVFSQPGYNFISIPEGVSRGQWTEQEAWAWHNNIGVIKGINQLEPGYPGMTRLEVLQKAAETGYNSIRYFLSGSLAGHKAFLADLLDEAEIAGLRVSPVLGIKTFTDRYEGEERINNARAYIHDIIYTFRDDPRIEVWDVCNEPRDRDLPLTKLAILWAREAGPSQPITASPYYWHTYFMEDSPERMEIALMNDIHNFHAYFFNFNEMEGIEGMVRFMKELGDRPMICSEWLARSQGDGFARVLPYFAKYQIHWQNWGLYNGDRNWGILWDESTFDPHDPWFHDVLHPDGTPYDYREIELIRNFDFRIPESDVDPGIEITDRWAKDRAWRYYVHGPFKGWTFLPFGNNSKHSMWRIDTSDQQQWVSELSRLASAGCDGLRIYLDFNTWLENPELFLERVDHFLSIADQHGFSVVPIIIIDEDAGIPIHDIRTYTRSVVHKFGRDTRVFCWELYEHPAKYGVEEQKAREMLQAVFSAARFEFPGQPLTATPAVKVLESTEDQSIRRELIHGGRQAGWANMTAEGNATLSLCAYIWSLSDILSFSSDQSYEKTGLLLSVANRYGRPVICTSWNAPDLDNAIPTLDHFGLHHVRWFAVPYHSDTYPEKSFRNYGIFSENVLSNNSTLKTALDGFKYTRKTTKRRIYYEIDGVRSVVGR